MDLILPLVLFDQSTPEGAATYVFTINYFDAHLQKIQIRCI